MSGTEVEQPASPRPATTCPRCGATIEGDQAWCLECGLAARTRLARTPNWKAPIVVAGVLGLAAIAALIVAFLVITGDNAPLPTTAAPAPAPAATTPPTTPTAVPTTTTPPPTTPTTPGGQTVPVTSTPAPRTTATAPAPTSTAPSSGGTPAP